MADVFISYKKSDADRVRPLVTHLRDAGLDVWWDEGIQPSTSWRAEIAKQLAAAKCVVAVWTNDSVDHEQGAWVMEEATHGLARKVLAPVRLDLVAPPLGFGEVQYADLAAWSGGGDDPRLKHFISVVQAIVRAEPMPAAPRPTHFEAPGIKLQGVTMQNVNIHVGERGRDNEDADDDAPTAAAAPARRGGGFSPSMFITRAIGVIFPLVGIIIFVFAMGGMACDAGNAPGAFCRALDALRQ
ncbi:MAG: toll/interleukin-1 receptor domain-containing protein [Hyphomonadaceae bacterium JAD_PAG50586_4]|nr:MAG: toll/interleukin-1 receptor domain-containing protein [Hyphomonadaceae bacterium JAD_PAG50586_4]